MIVSDDVAYPRQYSTCTSLEAMTYSAGWLVPAPGGPVYWIWWAEDLTDGPRTSVMSEREVQQVPGVRARTYPDAYMTWLAPSVREQILNYRE